MTHPTDFLLILLFQISLFVVFIDAEETFAIAAYFPDYRLDFNVNVTATLLTDLILFSQEPNADASLDGCCLKPKDYETARQAKAYKKETTGKSMRIWLSIGGWGRSKEFEEIVNDSERRKQLVKNLRQVCKKEGLDGVDFDWEQPLNVNDFKMYYALIRLTFQVFQREGLLVSVALHKGMYMPSKMYQFVDRINLMTYDIDMMSGGYHADYDKVTGEIKSFLSSNAPPGKLVMGIPMYARDSKKFALTKTMAELVEDANNNASFIVRHSSVGDLQWDNPQKIDAKVKFAMDKGLAGVFFWELGQDFMDHELGPAGILLTATAESAKKYLQTSDKNDNHLISDEL